MLTRLSRYYVSAESLSVIGKPSSAAAAKVKAEEEQRISTRKADLGVDKLKELEEELEEAKAESDRPPPSDMISGFPLTDASSIAYTSRPELTSPFCASQQP